MMIFRLAALAVLAAVACLNVQAADDPEDHAAHHPAAKHQAIKAPGSDAESDMATEKQMAAMQDMHEKMMAAKTPEERQALMSQHMKVMQDSMAMMRGMGTSRDAAPMMGMDTSKAGRTHGGMMPGQAMRHSGMEKRLDMMASMMQMMMDRMAGPMDGPPR